MRQRLRKRLKDKDNPMPPVVWDWVKVPQGWTLGSDTDEASLHTVLDAGPRNTLRLLADGRIADSLGGFQEPFEGRAVRWVEQ